MIKRRNLLKWLSAHADTLIGADNPILYTYWFDYATSALLDFRNVHTCHKVVTRAHGGDLYEDRRKFSYIPFRHEAIEKIDFVFLISKDGLDYISSKYPLQKSKFVLSPLGIENKNIVANESADDVFRIVSCSFVSPVKRVDKIFNTINILSGMTKKNIEWFHIGGGQQLKLIQDMTSTLSTSKVKAFLMGSISNKEIFSFYKNQPLDLFLMLSSSEGKPVAMMEALSVGLPVVATNVGGIPELIDQNINGFLVDVNDSPVEIAHVINSLIEKPNFLKEMRKSSKLKWSNVANSTINYALFAEHLKKLF